jgi:hypothetical protein
VATAIAVSGCADSSSEPDLGVESAQATEESPDSDAVTTGADSASETTVGVTTDAGYAPRPTMDAANAAKLDQTVALVGGGELDLGTLTDRPVLLWFWAPF